MMFAIATNAYVAVTDNGWWPVVPLACIAVLGWAWWTYERRWGLWRGSWCQRHGGHLWFPGPPEPREFIPGWFMCLRCMVSVDVPPWGRCMRGHPLADHYDERCRPVEVAGCPGPH